MRPGFLALFFLIASCAFSQSKPKVQENGEPLPDLISDRPDITVPARDRWAADAATASQPSCPGRAGPVI